MGPNNILEVVVITYYGYICSDDDDPNSYEFNPHPYGVVDLDAYYGSNLPDEDLKMIIIVVEYYYGRNGKTHSNDNPEGVVNIYIDAYAGGTRTDVLIISRLNAAGRFGNIFYNESPECVVYDAKFIIRPIYISATI